MPLVVQVSIEYHRVILFVGNSIRVREDVSLHAKRPVSFVRKMPEAFGRWRMNKAYDFGRVVNFSLNLSADTSEVVVGPLAPGIHRVTLMYDFMPRWRGDTFLFPFRLKGFPLNTLYGEMVIVAFNSDLYRSLEIIPSGRGKFERLDVKAFNTVRFFSTSPLRQGDIAVFRLVIPGRGVRYRWELLFFLLLAILVRLFGLTKLTK
ncbi:MAG: hypothetical protein GXO39_04020 [Thermotogae bacterium]|nr:hypothetical protein [Thermotogota bacterium]